MLRYIARGKVVPAVCPKIFRRDWVSTFFEVLESDTYGRDPQRGRSEASRRAEDAGVVRPKATIGVLSTKPNGTPVHFNIRPDFDVGCRKRAIFGQKYRVAGSIGNQSALAIRHL